MTEHSSIVGGSTADRLLNCPGSYQAIMALPPSVEKPSDYALEGSAMHEVMANLMRLRMETPDHSQADAIADMIGSVFVGIELTREHVDTMILPALRELDRLEEEYGNHFEVIAVERSVAFPGIPGAHGTCDLILANLSNVLHVDWKFGQGVPVKAIYTDPAGDVVNAQLMFYVCAAKASAASKTYTGRQLVGAIIQPRNDTPLTHTVITRGEVRWFIEDLRKAVVKALDRDPDLRRGEHCRWCPAKITCPLWTAPMLNLATIDEMGSPARTEMVSDKVTAFGEYLARAKALVDMLGLFKKEVDEQLHAYLEDGGKVPGWRLKAKAKQRQWIDEEIVEQTLQDLGFRIPEIWRQQLQTFAATDATAKRLGVEIPVYLRAAPETTETTVCRDDDPAPAVTKPLAIEQFRQALIAIGGVRR